MTSKTKTPAASLLLLNGGVGKRANLGQPKQFHEINGHPIMAHTIIAALRIPAIQEIIVNAPKGYEQPTREIMEHYCGKRPFVMVPGGATRQTSVLNLVQAATCDRVLLHETARPVITSETYTTLLEHEAENVGYFADIPFSMCRLDPETQTLVKNVRRDRVFNIQLPQKFNRNTLLESHLAAKQKKKSFTEDAVLVHKMSKATVHALPGDQRNIKVTSPKDLVLVSQLMSLEK